jgi:energy-coupling factor transport system ATP-binding protein
MSAIKLNNLDFTYPDGTRALRGLSLEQREGEFVVVAGGTGAGKSTLLKCLNGIIPGLQKGRLTGSVELRGQDISGRTVGELAGTVGLVLQDFESQLFCTDVESEVAFGPENLGVARPDIAARIRQALGDVGLSGFEGRDPAMLSGGEKQRLVIASVLALQPEILLLDEPTSDLDPAGREAVLEILRRLCRGGRTVLLVEHELEQLDDVSGILFLREGRMDSRVAPAVAMRDPAAFLRHGIRAPDMASLCGEIGIEPADFTHGAVYEALNARGLGLSAEKCGTLAAESCARGAADPVVEVVHASHSYDGTARALADVSVTIRRGEIVAIVGGNGSGKTTLVQSIAGLLQPEEGTVRLERQDLRSLSLEKITRVVGYVFQNPDQQLFSSTVGEDVAFGPRNFGMPEKEIPSAVAEALSRVGLPGTELRDPFTLTRGERQRVAVASVLVSRPSLVIMDEPTTGLDWPGQVGMMELTRELNREGRTIILVTHSMWLAAAYADRVIVMREGKVILDGPTREVFAQRSRLAEARLRAPSITQLSAMYNQTLLTVNEFLHCLSGRCDRS